MSDTWNDADPRPAAAVGAPAVTPAADAAKTAPPSAGFTFTDDGCRTELRLGALLLMAGVFLWAFLGPQKSSWLVIAGIPLLLIGVPVQAIQARQGRPGFPWKVGLSFAALGLAMCYDLRYREDAGGPLHIQPVAFYLLVAGLWILAWWPLAAAWKRKFRVGQA
jgi:hypothetical protein